MPRCVNRGSSLKYLDVGGGLGINYGGALRRSRAHQLQPAGIRERGRLHGERGLRGERRAEAGSGVRMRARASPRTIRCWWCPCSARTARRTVEVNLSAGAAAGGGARSPPVWRGPAVDEICSRCWRPSTTRRNGDEARPVHRLGYLDLEQRALADTLYWRMCREVLTRSSPRAEPPPPEQLQLEGALTDLYLCDFSVFHSMLDHWAIGQLFPVMPSASARRATAPPRARSWI